MSKPRGVILFSLLSAVAFARAAAAAQTVQIPVESLLDGRPVTTLTNGALVTWTVGVDKDDGFITSAAAAFLKQAGTALPDDATFAANAEHPQMVLHFANTAPAQSAQARGLSGVGTFDIDVPHATYSGLFLAILSSYGDCPLTFSLQYTDASSTDVQLTLPDWGTGKPLPTNPPVFFNLIAGLHKWDKNNASVDTPTHSLTGLRLDPAAGKQLSRVHVSKTSATPYLVFFGATGVATSAVDAGGAGGAGGASGASGAGGAGGASAGGAGGASGAGGAGGASGMAGSSAAAGSAGSAPLASGGGAGLAGMSGGGAPSAALAGAAATAGGLGGATAGAPSLASSNDSGGCAFAAQRARPELGWLLMLLGACAWRRARLNSRR